VTTVRVAWEVVEEFEDGLYLLLGYQRLRLFEPSVLERIFNATARYSILRWRLGLFPCKPDLTFTLLTARPM
jgi:hypothetical protein